MSKEKETMAPMEGKEFVDGSAKEEEGFPPLEDDVVVEEFDVYTMVSPEDANMYLLQFPLREKDRSYENVQRVRLKPQVKKMEWMMPLDRHAASFNGGSNNPEISSLRSISLQSSLVDPETKGLAAAVRFDRSIYLLPISNVLQLRYSPAYLDKEKDRVDGPASRGIPVRATVDEKGPNTKDIKAVNIKQELAPITVQVKRHETEQQTEARLRSYAFHAQREEADSWVELENHPIQSEYSKGIIRNLNQSTLENQMQPCTFDPMTYLHHLTPGPSESGDQKQTCIIEHGKISELDDAMVIDDLGRPPSRVVQKEIPTEILNDLPLALKNVLVNVSSVLNLNDVRTLLSNWQASPAVASFVQSASDADLHTAISKCGEFTCIRHRYVLCSLENPSIDPLRSLILEILQEKEQVRRAEVSTLAKAKGVPVSDPLYVKIMKDLCTSRGSVWTLRPGAASN